MLYGELGRYPMQVYINQRMVCYWPKMTKGIRDCTKSLFNCVREMSYNQSGSYISNSA